MNITSIESFYEASNPSLTLFDTFVRKNSLVGITSPDHICYKCGSKEEYDYIRSLFETESCFLYESIISKRRIAIIKFRREIISAPGPIRFLELSDQKPDKSQVSSFDHIEVMPNGISYDEMVERLNKVGEVIKVERPHHVTHDLDIGGFIFRCTREPLIEKIKREEMV